MAAKTRGRRRRKPASTPLGKESWQIVDQDGNVLREVGYAEGAALGIAQGLAQKFHWSDCPTNNEPALPAGPCNCGTITFTVRLKPLFGDPDVFYTVVRTEDGDVLTYRHS